MRRKGEGKRREGEGTEWEERESKGKDERGRTDKGRLEGREEGERGGPGYRLLMQYTDYMYNIHINTNHTIGLHCNSACLLVSYIMSSIQDKYTNK